MAIGVGRGELVPFGSYYLAGFLHEKPLAKLREDMELLGIGRAEGVPESEDHIAALCDMMAGLITGSFGAPAATDDDYIASEISSFQTYYEVVIKGWGLALLVGCPPYAIVAAWFGYVWSLKLAIARRRRLGIKRYGHEPQGLERKRPRE